ncbi:MAG: co-chaperone GroES family protein [Allomuricauda sp.]
MELLKNKILAEPLPEQKSEGGIILMDSNLEKHQAKVVDIGPKVEHIKIGDTVRFNHNSAQYYDGKIILREDQDVILVM